MASLTRSWSLLIPAAWLASMGWLARTEIAPIGRRPAAATVSHAAPSVIRDDWWGIYYQTAKIGYTNQIWRPRRESAAAPDATPEGVAVTSVTELELPVQGTVRSVSITGAVFTDAGHQIESFNASIASGSQRLLLTGTRQAGALAVRLETGGQPAGAFTLPADVQLPELLTAPWRLADAQPGQRWQEEVFDPFSQQRQAAIIEVLRQEAPSAQDRRWTSREVLVIRATLAGLVSTRWVTRDGLVLREETPLGFLMVREPPAEARLVHRRAQSSAGDLAARLAVPTDLQLADPRAARALTLRIEGFGEMTDLTLEAPPRQHWAPDAQGGVLTLVQETPPTGANLTLPVTAAEGAPWLAPSLLVQSDDPAIRAQARAIIGEETEAWRAAARLCRWVGQTLRKTPSIGVPSAVEVLRTRQGDCNEHTVLLTALARSVGLPTQMCAGLVYYHGAFYYHAWPRVFVGQWVAMDPTLGQTVADATHVQLLEGDLNRQAGILRLLGRLRIEAVPHE